MQLPGLFNKFYIFNSMKLMLFNLLFPEGGNKVLVMNAHLKKDVGLCTEEIETRHYSRFL